MHAQTVPATFEHDNYQNEATSTNELAPVPNYPDSKDLNYESFIIKSSNKNTGLYTATIKQVTLVNKIVVEGYNLLTDEEVNAVTKKYESKNLTAYEIKKIADQINNMYKKYGVDTALVYIPVQNLETNILKIQVIEGRIGKINVVGNEHTDQAYIKNALHQKEGDIIYTPELKADIIKFNKNNDVQLKAIIKKGKEFGTSDITLNVTETNPYHIGLSTDNTGREDFGLYTGGINVQNDSVLGFRDKLNFNYLKTKSLNSTAGSYSFPIGYKGLRIGGLVSYDKSVVSTDELKELDITGKTHSYSIFATKPLVNNPNLIVYSTLGLNAKNSKTFILDQPLSDIDGSPDTKIRSLSAALTAIKYDKTGQWLFDSNFSQGVKIFEGNSSFFKYTGNVSRFQRVGDSCLLILRANTQLTPNKLPSIEQMQIGGTSTVRGYNEGTLIGDNAYFVSSELRFPMFILPKTIKGYSISDKIQGVLFAETAGAFPFDSAEKQHALSSVGMGLRVRLTNYLAGRVDYGFALMNKSEDLPLARLHFGVESALP